MSDSIDAAATIDGLNRLLSDSLAPELQRQEASIEEFLEGARQARERIHAVLVQAEAEVTAPFDTADNALDDFLRQLEPLGTALGSSETESTALFETQAGDALSRLDDTKQRFLAVEQALNQGRTTSESAATIAEGEVEQLIGATEAACGQLAQGAEQAGEQLEGARGRIEQAVTILDTALGEMQEAVNRGLEALEQHVGDETKEVGATVTEMLNSAREAISDFCGTSDEVLDDLSGAADKLAEVFGGDAKEILDKVKDLLEVIEKIRPLLEAVEQWT